MGTDWRFRSPENMQRVVGAHKDYLLENISNHRHYIGKVTCPKCGAVGYLSVLVRKNKRTNNEFRGLFHIEHKLGKGKRKFCAVTKYYSLDERIVP